MFVPCITRRSRNDQQYAQICTTSLFYIPAPTCFGNILPSSGSFWIRLSYMKIQIGLVVYHIMLVKWPVCRSVVGPSVRRNHDIAAMLVLLTRWVEKYNIGVICYHTAWRILRMCERMGAENRGDPSKHKPSPVCSIRNVFVKPLVALINWRSCRCCCCVSKHAARAKFPRKWGQKRMQSDIGIQIHDNRISVTNWCFVTAVYPDEVGVDNGWKFIPRSNLKSTYAGRQA
jgi:hypothetical protein